MNRTWVLVANRSGAKFLENTGLKKGLNLIDEYLHPEARYHGKDYTTDRDGTSGGSTLSKAHTLRETDNDSFAKEISNKLRLGRAQNQYDKLIIVSEASFLGMLRNKLDPQIGNMITSTVNKDLYSANSEKLETLLDAQLENAYYSDFH